MGALSHGCLAGKSITAAASRILWPLLSPAIGTGRLRLRHALHRSALVRGWRRCWSTRIEGRHGPARMRSLRRRSARWIVGRRRRLRIRRLSARVLRRLRHALHRSTGGIWRLRHVLRWSTRGGVRLSRRSARIIGLSRLQLRLRRRVVGRRDQSIWIGMVTMLPLRVLTIARNWSSSCLCSIGCRRLSILTARLHGALVHLGNVILDSDEPRPPAGECQEHCLRVREEQRQARVGIQRI